jgi:phosphate transport system protein
MERHFEREIEQLKMRLTRMAEVVEDQVNRATQALLNGDVYDARQVMGRDHEVDDFDTEIDRECQRIFALTQPVAMDLRLLMASLGINSQLERIGDIAVNIAERVKPLRDHRDLLKSTHIPEMAEIALIMLQESIAAFFKGDPEIAQRVLASDDVVDDLNRKAFQQVVARMKEDTSIVEPGAHLLILSRHVERLADHATNIAEDCIFVVQARMVKHNA